MEEESPKPTSTPTGAVFLSYASQDVEAAKRICDALRAAGVEVWFDQSELRGGDAWDQSIRKQIKTCALFVPVISKHTHERAEGYFRLEWKLAVDRSHLITAHKAFLVPVVIDDTGEDEEHVPDKFREVQWTRLPAGETPSAFVDRVQRLLSPEGSTMFRAAGSATSGAGAVREQAPASWRSKLGLPVTVAVVVTGMLAYFAIDKFWISKHTAPPTPPAAPSNVAPAAFAPPPHSIAVLPFVNMSGDASQEYFSDGVTEELLNSLARINELQVAARTSSFSFKGKDADISIIAHKLNVASVLEGSVRRAGNTIRITAQLNNAVTGFHLWSQTYDRDLSNVLQLQTEIANAVANALKVTLLGDVAAKIEVGGTRNPAAFDGYLRASKAFEGEQNGKDLQAAISEFAEAIHRDPDFALAYARRSLAFARFARIYADGRALGDYLNKAQADARKAIALAPDLADGHVALAKFLTESLQFIPASQEYERALALAPGNARILGPYYGVFAVLMGRTEVGLAATRRSVVLDPLNSGAHLALGYALNIAGRYRDSVAALRDAKTLDPNNGYINAHLGFAYYAVGDYQSALAACELADEGNKPLCLACVYDKIGRHADAEAILAKIRASYGDDGALGYATIYLAWGDTARALDWLETAMRLRDPWLVYVKADRQFDPLRKEPRFQAIERELKFPN